MGVYMTTINDEIRIREGETNQTYGKLYVNDDKELRFVDSYGTDTSLLQDNVGVSEATFQENKNAQGQINQSMQQALDGYAAVGDISTTGNGRIAFFTETGTNIAGSDDLFYDQSNGRLGIKVNPVGGLHILSNSNSTIPTEFTNDDLIVGKPDANGSDSGAVFLRYDQSHETGFIGCLSPSVAWRKLVIGSYDSVYQNASGGAVAVISGASNANSITQRSDNTLAWCDGTDALTTPDAGLSRASAGTIAVGNGTQGDASGSILVSNITATGNVSIDGNIINAELTETLQFMQQALDGYNGVSEATFQENKNAQNQINNSIIRALDGYTVADGYVNAIRSVFTDATTGIWDYDTSPAPSFRESNLYWYCACLDGNYSSGTYQEFRCKPFQIPMDYLANSGGIIRIHAFCDGTGGNMFFPDIGALGVRAPNNTQTLSWFNSSSENSNVVVANTQSEEMFVFYELDLNNGHITGGPVKAGDLISVRIQRRAGNANDTATGTLAIMGFEFIYNSNIPR
jgi:hypothetical protein